MLNRAVLIVRPAQPFLDWAATLDDSGLVPSPDGEQTVYLVPEFEDDGEMEKVLKRAFAEVFARELYGWHTDESAWPKKRTLKMFREWLERCEFRLQLLELADALVAVNRDGKAHGRAQQEPCPVVSAIS